MVSVQREVPLWQVVPERQLRLLRIVRRRAGQPHHPPSSSRTGRQDRQPRRRPSGAG